MKPITLRNVLLKAAALRDGKRVITCTKALALAGKHGVSPGRIGKLCDDANIKIRQCKLGCF